jgi:ArsR family transcriptional regulator
MSLKCCPPAAPIDPNVDPDEELARYAKALGHPARVKILRFLLEREECMAGAIAEELPLAQSTVSQHLKVLREAGLIHGEVDGPRICYCADETRIEHLRGLLGGLVSLARV